MPDKKKQSETHKEELIRRFKEAFGYSPLKKEENFQETLIVENAAKGLIISLQSTKTGLNEMFTLSRKIKKEFFENEKNKIDYTG